MGRRRKERKQMETEGTERKSEAGKDREGHVLADIFIKLGACSPLPPNFLTAPA